MKVLAAVLAAALFIGTVPASAGNLVSDSEVWYAKTLRSLFPRGVEIHGTTYLLDWLPCLPKDITQFSVTVGRKDIGLGPAFAVEGSVALGKFPSSFRTMSSDRKYVLHLQAFLIDSSGRTVWSQKGYPRGNQLVSADGGSSEFILINAYSGEISGYRALILAAADPIISEYRGTRVLVGAKMVTVQ